jgi:excisionase family DNA binding protein
MLEKQQKLAFTVKEVSEILGVSIRTAWQIINDKEIPSIKVSKTTKVTKADLDEYMSKKI